MTAPGAFASFNLLENFSWSSSSSSTPQYSPRASFSSPGEQALNPLPAEFLSPCAGAAAAGPASTRDTAAAGETTSSAAGGGRLTAAKEEDNVTSPDAGRNADSTSKTTCSSASTKKFCDTFTAHAGKAGTAGFPASAAALKIRPATSVRAYGPAAAASAGRESPAFGAGVRGSAAFAASPAAACLAFAAGGAARTAAFAAPAGGEEGRGGRGEGWPWGQREGEERRRSRGGGDGGCLRGVRLLASLLTLRDPVRDAAISSVSCGCYIFLLAASVRFFFYCSSGPAAPLAAAKTDGPVVAADSTNSFASVAFPHFLDASVLESSPSSFSWLLSLPDESVSSPPFLSHQKLTSDSRASHSPSFPSSPCLTASSSVAASFLPASPAVHDCLPSPPPPSVSFPSPLHPYTPSATADPSPSSSSSSSAAAVSADVVETSRPSQNWFPADLYPRVAYSLCAAWAAAGACAAVAALLMYRSHGGILTAGSMLDVRFSVDRRPADIDSEEHYYYEEEEEQEAKAAAEEAEWLAIDAQASYGASTAKEGEGRAADDRRRATDFRVAGAAACSEAEERPAEREEGMCDGKVPVAQPGKLQRQQEELQMHEDERQQDDAVEKAAQLSQQQQSQQQEPDERQEPCQQHPQHCGQEEQQEEKRAAEQQVAETCREAPEQKPGDLSTMGECYRQVVSSEERSTSPVDKSRARRSTLGISFMGQGQTGSFAAAIRRGSVSSGLSISSVSNRVGSMGSSVSSSSLDPSASRLTAAALPTNAGDLAACPHGAGGATAAGLAPHRVTAGPAAPRHAISETLPTLQHQDDGRRNLVRKNWIARRTPRQRQQQEHRIRQQGQEPLEQPPESRLVPLLTSAPRSTRRSQAPYLPRPSLGSWTASCVSLAVGGSLCACLQEFSLVLAVALEKQRPNMWSVVTCFAYSDWVAIELIALALRYWGPLLPRWRARGALVVAAANAVLLVLLHRSGSASSLTQHLQEPAGLQASAEASKADKLVREPVAAAALLEEATKPPLPFQRANATAEPALSEWSGAVVFFAVLASACALLADVSLTFCLESGVSVESTVIIRCSTQGAIGAAGILHGVIAGNPILRGEAWRACSSGLFCPALAGVIFGPLAVYAFSQSIKRSTLLLGATVRSTCWVIVALLALLAHGQPLASAFASALSLTFAGTCLSAWDSRQATYTTGQDTDASAQNHRVSSDHNEHSAFSSPVYHELLEHGQFSGESSLSSTTDKPRSHSAAYTSRNG